jgi:hypothetical protein
LIEEAGKDPATDARISGLIQGYKDFVYAQLEDIETEV